MWIVQSKQMMKSISHSSVPWLFGGQTQHKNMTMTHLYRCTFGKVQQCPMFQFHKNDGLWNLHNFVFWILVSICVQEGAKEYFMMFWVVPTFVLLDTSGLLHAKSECFCTHKLNIKCILSIILQSLWDLYGSNITPF